MKSRLLSAIAVAGLAAYAATTAMAQTRTLYVRVGPNSPPPRSALKSRTNIPVMQIEVTAVGGNVEVGWVDVYHAGTGPFNGIAIAKIWEEGVSTTNGYVDSLSEFALQDGFQLANAGPPSYWSIPNHAKTLTTVLDGSTERWLIAYDFNANPATGNEYYSVLYNEPAGRISIDARIPAGPAGSASVVLLDGSSPVSSLSSSVLTIANASTEVSEPVPGGVSADQFVMICPSITPSPVGGFAQIEAQLGPPGPSGTWRLFRYNETSGGYQEYGEAGFPATMDVTFGWWFISRRSASLRFQGTSTQGSASFLLNLPLPAGAWVQIGNPYNAEIPLSYIDVQQAAGVAALNSAGNARTSRQLYRYAGGGYVAETAAMQPGTGYWVYVITNTALTFHRPPNALKPGQTLSRERALYADEASPPLPPSIGSGDGGSGGGGCFASAGAGMAGLTMLLGLGAAGAVAAFRRRAR